MKTMKTMLTACLGLVIQSTPVAQAYPEWVSVKKLEGKWHIQKKPYAICYIQKFKIINNSSFYAITNLINPRISVKATYSCVFGHDTRSSSITYSNKYFEIKPNSSAVIRYNIIISNLFKGTMGYDNLELVTKNSSSDRVTFKKMKLSFDVKSIRMK